MAHLRLIAAVACATAAAAAPTSSRGLPATSPSGTATTLPNYLLLPWLQKMRGVVSEYDAQIRLSTAVPVWDTYRIRRYAGYVIDTGDGHDAGLELRVEDGAQGLERPLLRNVRSLLMVPLLGGAMCACTWHFFYNSESLEVLVALQGVLTVIGNITMCIAAFRIFKASQESSKSS
uniref:Uncharacterized protein n=1 Tax=Oryza sativa subsp. japonica TaxID=39947 RepID=Q650U1_ORYSJ|nr:hypothetical protein [Oryza sativa Japonica Group]